MRRATADRARVAQRLANIIRHGAQGEALARKLAREGVKSRADLRRPEIFSRLPRESQSNVLYSPSRHIPLAAAQAIVSELQRRLALGVPRCEVIPVGSVRRQAPRVKDMDILVVVPAGSEARLGRALTGDAVSLRPARPGDRLEIADTYLAGPRRRSLVLRAAPATRSPSSKTARRAPARYYRVDLFAFTQKEKPFALFHYTGSKAYNIRTRAFAKRKGWRLNQYGLFKGSSGHKVRGSSAVRTERALAEFLGISYRLPADRQH
jgi:DNA polymerase (family 10)